MYIPNITKVGTRKNLSNSAEEEKLIRFVKSAREHVSDCKRAAQAPRSTKADWKRLNDARLKLYKVEEALFNFRNK